MSPSIDCKNIFTSDPVFVNQHEIIEDEINSLNKIQSKRLSLINEIEEN